MAAGASVSWTVAGGSRSARDLYAIDNYLSSTSRHTCRGDAIWMEECWCCGDHLGKGQPFA